jgi:peptidoglycan/LPS O-acetylase OafA/YrhL
MRDPNSDVGRYLGGLDGLRAVACLTVLAAHCIGHFAPVATPNGVAQILAQGMTVFFVLSGMLIYLPFARRILNGGRGTGAGRYARRRLMRIFPAYVVIFLICDFVLAAVYPGNATVTARPYTDAGTGRITSPGEVLLQLSLLQTFVPSRLQTGIPPAWSLATELTFYAVVPVLVWAVARRSSRSAVRVFAPPVALLVVGLIGRGVLTRLFDGAALTVDRAEFGPYPLAVFSRSLLVFADNFAVGMAVAALFVWTERGAGQRWTARRATVVGWVMLVGGALVGLGLLDHAHWYVGTATGIAAGGLVLLVSDPAARGRRTWVSGLANAGPLRYVGEISYSVYLWHLPMVVIVARAGWFATDSLRALAGATVAVAALSIVLGTVTFRLVERPAMRWASR